MNNAENFYLKLFEFKDIYVTDNVLFVSSSLSTDYEHNCVKSAMFLNIYSKSGGASCLLNPEAIGSIIHEKNDDACIVCGKYRLKISLNKENNLYYIGICESNRQAVTDGVYTAVPERAYETLTFTLSGYLNNLSLAMLNYHMMDKTSETFENSMRYLDKPVANNIEEISQLLDQSDKDMNKDDLSSFMESNIGKVEFNSTVQKMFDSVKDTVNDNVKEKPTLKTMFYNFTNSVFKNDFTRIEELFNSSLTSKNPAKCVYDFIAERMGMTDCGKNLFVGISDNDYERMTYMISVFIKSNVGTYMKSKDSQRQSFKNMLVPVSVNVISTKPENNDIMYDGYMYITYLKIVKDKIKSFDNNITNNKELLGFVFKNIMSPLIFTYIKSIDKETFVNECVKRYVKYRNDGTFDEFEKKIKEFTAGIDVSVSQDFIKNDIESSFDQLLQVNSDMKYRFDQHHTKKTLILDWTDMTGVKNCDDIIDIEMNVRNHNGEVDYSLINQDELEKYPESILKKYKIKLNKPDKDIFKNYISDYLPKDDIDLLMNEIGTKPYSSDFIETINGCDLNVLRAIVSWDIKDILSVTNEEYYKEKIKNNTLKRIELMSIISD